MSAHPAEKPSPSSYDQRRHRRVEIVLPARFMLPDRSEHTATVLDISAGGISLESETLPAKGMSVIVYVKDIGRLEGMVVRQHARGFAVEFDATQVHRDRLVDKLTLQINNIDAGDIQERKHARVAAEADAQLILSDGRSVNCRVLDMSFGGVSLAVDVFPKIGEHVLIGRMRGRVVRHHEHGIGVAFDDVHTSWGSLAASVKPSQDTL